MRVIALAAMGAALLPAPVIEAAPVSHGAAEEASSNASTEASSQASSRATARSGPRWQPALESLDRLEMFDASRPSLRGLPARHLGADLVDAREIVEKVLVAEEGEISERGAVVVLVQADGPVDRAGLRPADVIIELGGARVDGTVDLLRILASRAVGSSLPLAYVRDGQVKTGRLEVAGPEHGPGGTPQAFLLRPGFQPLLRLPERDVRPAGLR